MPPGGRRPDDPRYDEGPIEESSGPSSPIRRPPIDNPDNFGDVEMSRGASGVQRISNQDPYQGPGTFTEEELIKEVDPDASVKFTNRRRMAWMAMISMIMLMIVLLFGEKYISNERLKVLEQPIVWFFFAMTGVVAAYMGFTTQLMAKFPNMRMGGGRMY